MFLVTEKCTQQKDNYIKLWIKMFSYGGVFLLTHLEGQISLEIKVTLKYPHVS